MKDTIRLNGLKFAAKHGCHSEEKSMFQPFEVDVEITCDLSVSSQSDRLEDTIDYSRIVKIVQAVVMGGHCNLIERLAGLILERLCEIVPEGVVKVRVRKPRAPLPATFESIEVELCRETGV